MKPIALTQALIRQPAQTLRIIKSRLRTALYNLGLRYSYSVLTHLSVDNQQPWMTELARVLRPGGRLLVTVHGKRVAWRGGLPAEKMERLENEGVLALEEGRSGTNHCCAFHPPRWMREQESIGLELIEHMEGGANDGSEQDIYLFRAASVPAAAERPTNDVC